MKGFLKKMKSKKVLFILSFIVIILIMIIIFIFTKFNKKPIEEQENNMNAVEQQSIIDGNDIREENALIFSIEKKEEEPENNEVKKQTIDAATLTNEIYSMNREIGTLYIPKTGLTSAIFSSVTVEKMEQMPCFLFTTGGLNKIGTTLFVGHNRMNGKLFSENRKLEEGDEFYFKDYEGNELKYVIYSKFITTESDTSYLSENVDKPTIALSCCTDENNENRIIILGKAE